MDYEGTDLAAIVLYPEPQSTPCSECDASPHLTSGREPSEQLLLHQRKAPARAGLTSKSSEEPGHRMGSRPGVGDTPIVSRREAVFPRPLSQS